MTFRNCWIGKINYTSRVKRYYLIHCYFLNLEIEELSPQIELVVESPQSGFASWLNQQTAHFDLLKLSSIPIEILHQIDFTQIKVYFLFIDTAAESNDEGNFYYSENKLAILIQHILTAELQPNCCHIRFESATQIDEHTLGNYLVNVVFGIIIDVTWLRNMRQLTIHNHWTDLVTDRDGSGWKFQNLERIARESGEASGVGRLSYCLVSERKVMLQYHHNDTEINVIFQLKQIKI